MRLHKYREQNVDTILSSNALHDGLRQDLMCTDVAFAVLWDILLLTWDHADA